MFVTETVTVRVAWVEEECTQRLAAATNGGLGVVYEREVFVASSCSLTISLKRILAYRNERQRMSPEVELRECVWEKTLWQKVEDDALEMAGVDKNHWEQGIVRWQKRACWNSTKTWYCQKRTIYGLPLWLLRRKEERARYEARSDNKKKNAPYCLWACSFSWEGFVKKRRLWFRQWMICRS